MSYQSAPEIASGLTEFFRENGSSQAAVKSLENAQQLVMGTAKATRGETRTPFYVIHALSTAQVVAEEFGLGITATLSALLYNVVKESKIPIQEIENRFDATVRDLVEALIRLEDLPPLEASDYKTKRKNLILGLSRDSRVLLIKLASCFCKLKMAHELSKEQKKQIIYTAKTIYSPVAHRLGLYRVRSLFEDLYLKYTNTTIYSLIENRVNTVMPFQKEIIQRIKQPIEEQLDKRGIKFAIKTRSKTISSIWTKMKRSNLSMEQIYDLFAIRIILEAPLEQEKAICWQVYQIVTDLFKPHPTKFRNWLSYPRKNGYQSLHATVMSKNGTWIEVQIRTQRMDDMAERGYAAHWKYKEMNEHTATDGQDVQLEQLRTWLEAEERGEADPLDPESSTTDTILVFTQKGEPITLPYGATVLDFAFELNIIKGVQCTGAKVNHELKPIGHMLQHSDWVEVLTSNKQLPHESWLELSITHKAQNTIEAFLKKRKNKAIAKGQKVVRNKLSKWSFEPREEVLDELLVFFDEQSVKDLHYKLGEGIIDPQEVEKFCDFKTRSFQG